MSRSCWSRKSNEIDEVVKCNRAFGIVLDGIDGRSFEVVQLKNGVDERQALIVVDVIHAVDGSELWKLRCG